MTPTNRLANETSPYLLQHAHNPVDWYPWGEEAWEKARREDKLVLVSIGYSSCHWCHVMERESFEKDDTAAIMNKHFVCIKVDREERPDVDQVYMSAVQLMTGGGGWPLNCFCLPDGRPVYGGTYYPQAKWNELLQRLDEFYKENKEQAVQYATELTEGVRQSDFLGRQATPGTLSKQDAVSMAENWKKYFDNTEGGPRRAPKFPLPNNYEFLLHYGMLMKDQEILQHVFLTLDKMAMGGIYDQAGGGFARYSVDALWKVPHFEKMLYDNAQLVSLYSIAWQATQKTLYKDVVLDTLEFIRREMTSPDGGFYSALDADSEGEEGKFYVWKSIAPYLSGLKSAPNIAEEHKIKLLEDYFSINPDGYWEHGNYILLRKKSDEQLAAEYDLCVDDVRNLVAEAKRRLLEERSKRVRPGLDNKLLTSWNALMMTAYCRSYNAFGRKEDLEAALMCATLFLSKTKGADGKLSHMLTTQANSNQPGFLEDYAFLSQAFISLYECTLDETWLQHARQLADYALAHFCDADSGMFYFTSDLDTPLVARKAEIADNVIPSSNSAMARVLFYLSRYFDRSGYEEQALPMLQYMKDAMPGYGSGYSNWGILLLHHVLPFREIVVTGPDAKNKAAEIRSHYLPNAILAGSNESTSKLPLLEERLSSDRTLIYVCENKSCRLPVEEVYIALKEILV